MDGECHDDSLDHEEAPQSCVWREVAGGAEHLLMQSTKPSDDKDDHGNFGDDEGGEDDESPQAPCEEADAENDGGAEENGAEDNGDLRSEGEDGEDEEEVFEDDFEDDFEENDEDEEVDADGDGVDGCGAEEEDGACYHDLSIKGVSCALRGGSPSSSPPEADAVGETASQPPMEEPQKPQARFQRPRPPQICVPDPEDEEEYYEDDAEAVASHSGSEHEEDACTYDEVDAYDSYNEDDDSEGADEDEKEASVQSVEV